MFPFDIFEFIGGIFVIIFVIVIVFFIIVIVIVYKLLHTNVDNVKKKSAKSAQSSVKDESFASKENVIDEPKTKVIINTCKYCGQNIEENTSFCPYCGSNLSI